MRIAIDISPLSGASPHKVRGAGFYIESLKSSLKKYDQKNSYIFFDRVSSLSNNSVDVIHYPYFDPFFLTLPFLKEKKRVVTVHDLIPIIFPKHFPSGVRGKLKWLIQRSRLKKSDAIITDSENSKRDIVRILKVPESNVHAIPLSAHEVYKKVQVTKDKREEIFSKYSLPDKFVLYVGDATWNKNLPRLIASIKQINVTLVIVGKALASSDLDTRNPWNADLISVKKETDGDKRFLKLGFVPAEDLLYLYNLATIFVFPSLYEGFGFPVLEAMICGCPVVTTQNSSLPEIAGDAVQYVIADDVTSIANGIGEVFFGKSLQASLSKKGLLQAKKFSWEKTALETIKVYEKVYTR